MGNFLLHLFGTDFIPHGHCYLWRPGIVGLHVVADGLIAISYFLIPVLLIKLTRERRDLVFHWMFWMFAAFILLCGSTHILNVVTLWTPVYRFEGLVKLITGLVSIFTAVALIPLIPKVLALPRPEELAAANKALASQIEVTQGAQEQLRRLNTELEQRVARRTASLQRSNQDLAQFAYVASHDLQEPLRMISTYTALLKRRYAGHLDKEADQFIEYAVDGAKRMQLLISDLLSYSQYDNPEDVAPIDSRSALDAALSSLRLSIESEGAEIEVGEMPVVEADHIQLTQVFQNLISNSIKYRGEAPPHIKIWAERDPDQAAWTFYVRDNGKGFDPQYKDRIFDMFQRLQLDRPGTGIGLAICKKIVQRHGGHIDAISKLGEGSTFLFTIPATLDAVALI